MEAAATLVAPRLAEEGCVTPTSRCDILDRRLELEGSVCCVESFGVVEVDFILGWAELGVAGKNADLHLVEHAHQVQEVAVRVGHRAGCVNQAGLLVSATVSAVFGVVGKVKLKFWADHGL